ncbi:putative calcium-binding protein CML45 [Tasmannia lanceolata]|uniref:putative calcium-binding protein CML45 n=1 Tax=Tasmannia lanceolata TaxID=3420 RepID=UPI0040632A82
MSSSFSLADFVGFLFFHKILNWVIVCLNLYSIFLSISQSQVEFVIAKLKIYSERDCNNFVMDEKMKKMSSQQFCFNDKGGLELSREDVEMVMGKLGIFCNSGGEKVKECLNLNELSILFEEDEPSLEEVKEAFCVFDENTDGFIDAKELQRVLCNLGFMEGACVDTCEMMIKTFDENKDGRIDFKEFVKLMEGSFC